MRFEYPGNLDQYLTECKKIANELAVVNLQIPDKIMSYSILAKLPYELWHIVNTILLNKTIIANATLVLNKLQEMVHLKNSRKNNSQHESSTALLKTTQRNPTYNPVKKSTYQPPLHPCSPG